MDTDFAGWLLVAMLGFGVLVEVAFLRRGRRLSRMAAEVAARR